MNNDAFVAWCRNNNIAPHNRPEIEYVRNSPPSRSVRPGKGVSGRFPSRKMGVTIQFESHKNELPYIYELEHDEKVLEYYDQPPPIKFTNKDKNQKNIGYMHTPDFFVITKTKGYWVECKTEEELLKLSIDQPYRYQKDEDDIWICPPGIDYAEKFGLIYKVRSSKEINWNFQQNTEFLRDYFTDTFEVNEANKSIILQIVRNKLGITLQDLLTEITNSPYAVKYSF